MADMGDGLPPLLDMTAAAARELYKRGCGGGWVRVPEWVREEDLTELYYAQVIGSYATDTLEGLMAKFNMPDRWDAWFLAQICRRP